jgi:hypothetical protein
MERPARYAYHVGCPRLWAELSVAGTWPPSATACDRTVGGGARLQLVAARHRAPLLRIWITRGVVQSGSWRSPKAGCARADLEGV